MNRRLGNLLLSLGTVGIVIGLIEGVGHALLHPSPRAYAAVLGRDLPPFRVVPACNDAPRPAAGAAPDATPAGRNGKITRSDLYGIYRDDRVLGYAPLERAVSANGWWQSNNFGARDRRDVAAAPPPGTRRVVVFGESFGAGTRLPQEQTWSAVMAGALADTEVLNFAVDGYGMAQAYLRFRELRTKLKYDAAIMMFVPGADPPRDVNVYRPLLSWGWQTFMLVPRFVVANGRLSLIPRPDQSRAAFFAVNCHSIGDRLRTHLAQYDRFYVDARYRAGPPVLARSVLYRLGVAAYAHLLTRRVAIRMARPDSEAFAVSRAIFRQMDDDVRRDGAKFVLVILPLQSELNRLRADGEYRNRWRAMVASLCGGAALPPALSQSEREPPPLACIDLAGELAAVPAGRIDRGYDGTHYGPATDRRIGEFLARQMTQRKLLAENSRRPGLDPQ